MKRHKVLLIPRLAVSRRRRVVRDIAKTQSLKKTQPYKSVAFCITKHIVESTMHKLWLDYDEGADVLYISLQRPQKATDSIMKSPTTGASLVLRLDDVGVLLSYRGGQIIGITIFEASKR